MVSFHCCAIFIDSLIKFTDSNTDSFGQWQTSTTLKLSVKV